MVLVKEALRSGNRANPVMRLETRAWVTGWLGNLPMIVSSRGENPAGPCPYNEVGISIAYFGRNPFHESECDLVFGFGPAASRRCRGDGYRLVGPRAGGSQRQRNKGRDAPHGVCHRPILHSLLAQCPPRPELLARLHSGSILPAVEARRAGRLGPGAIGRGRGAA